MFCSVTPYTMEIYEALKVSSNGCLAFWVRLKHAKYCKMPLATLANSWPSINSLSFILMRAGFCEEHASQHWASACVRKHPASTKQTLCHLKEKHNTCHRVIHLAHRYLKVWVLAREAAEAHWDQELGCPFNGPSTSWPRNGTKQQSKHQKWDAWWFLYRFLWFLNVFLMFFDGFWSYDFDKALV